MDLTFTKKKAEKTSLSLMFNIIQEIGEIVFTFQKSRNPLKSNFCFPDTFSSRFFFYFVKLNQSFWTSDIKK